jgi:hypothetical protein
LFRIQLYNIKDFKESQDGHNNLGQCFEDLGLTELNN